MSEEAEVANADESRRQQVQQKAAQELIDRKRHEALLVFVRRIAPAESDSASVEGDQAMVGDGHPVRVAAEIVQGMLGTAKGALGINHPVGTEERAQHRLEGLGSVQRDQRSMEVELSPVVQLAQPGNELAAEDSAKHFHRKEESVGGANPACMIRI